MKKTQKKKGRKLVAMLMSVIMLLSCSVCSAPTAFAAEKTKEATAEANADKDSKEDDEKDEYSFSENTTGNSELIADEKVITENGQFQFIAVTTRDEDIFYVIIDKSKVENNVYFLNEVDTADIAKFASDDSNTSSSGDAQTEEETEPTEQEEASTQADATAQNDSSYVLYALIGIAILGGLGFALFKMKSKGKSKKENEQEYSDEEFFYDAPVNEDSTEEKQ